MGNRNSAFAHSRAGSLRLESAVFPEPSWATINSEAVDFGFEMIEMRNDSKTRNLFGGVRTEFGTNRLPSCADSDDDEEFQEVLSWLTSSDESHVTCDWATHRCMSDASSIREECMIVDEDEESDDDDVEDDDGNSDDTKDQHRSLFQCGPRKINGCAEMADGSYESAIFNYRTQFGSKTNLVFSNDCSFSGLEVDSERTETVQPIVDNDNDCQGKLSQIATSQNRLALRGHHKRSGRGHVAHDTRDLDLLNQNEVRDLVPEDLERAEVDWLCEPEWNNRELEIFWHLLEPHFKKLLQVRDWSQLPDPCVPIVYLDPGDSHLLDRSLLHVQWHIWKGHYSQAVSDFRFVKSHFRCGAKSLFLERERIDDIEDLKLVFRKKRPTKFRLWM